MDPTSNSGPATEAGEDIAQSRTDNYEPAQRFGSPQGWAVAGVLVVLVVIGLGFRVSRLGAVGFAEDEVNKVEAVQAYRRGDITANAEHPMFMKALMFVSMTLAVQGGGPDKVSERIRPPSSQCHLRRLNGNPAVSPHRRVLRSLDWISGSGTLGCRHKRHYL